MRGRPEVLPERYDTLADVMLGSSRGVVSTVIAVVVSIIACAVSLASLKVAVIACRDIHHNYGENITGK
jgi:uncharacterized membrane protein YccF (DUF307 family)